MSRVKKIFLNSRFRSSGDSTDFKITLKENLYIPIGTQCAVDDIAIPNSFHTIMAGINDKFYVYRLAVHTMFTLTPNNYTASTLAAHLQTLLNNAYSPEAWTCTYNSTSNKITITSDTNTFYVSNYNTLRDSYPTINDSCNSIINFTSQTLGLTHVSNNINILATNVIYLRSDALTNNDSIDCMGNHNIIKAIPVSAVFGNTMFDSLNDPVDFFDAGEKSLRTIDFTLTNDVGLTLNNNNAEINFTIVLRYPDEK